MIKVPTQPNRAGSGPPMVGVPRWCSSVQLRSYCQRYATGLAQFSSVLARSVNAILLSHSPFTAGIHNAMTSWLSGLILTISGTFDGHVYNMREKPIESIVISHTRNGSCRDLQIKKNQKKIKANKEEIPLLSKLIPVYPCSLTLRAQWI